MQRPHKIRLIEGGRNRSWRENSFPSTHGTNDGRLVVRLSSETESERKADRRLTNGDGSDGHATDGSETRCSGFCGEEEDVDVVLGVDGSDLLGVKTVLR